MRLIREQVVGEISATAYKKLVLALKPLNKRQLWAILDHYLFHVITDVNVEELLRHVKEMNDRGVDVTAASEDDIAAEFLRPRFADTITAEALEANKDRLVLMFDATYFDTYLQQGAQKTVAKKLVDFCTTNSLPVASHWQEYAGKI